MKDLKKTFLILNAACLFLVERLGRMALILVTFQSPKTTSLQLSNNIHYLEQINTTPIDHLSFLHSPLAFPPTASQHSCRHSIFPVKRGVPVNLRDSNSRDTQSDAAD